MHSHHPFALFSHWICVCVYHKFDVAGKFWMEIYRLLCLFQNKTQCSTYFSLYVWVTGAWVDGYLLCVCEWIIIAGFCKYFLSFFSLLFSNRCYYTYLVIIMFMIYYKFMKFIFQVFLINLFSLQNFCSSLFSLLLASFVYFSFYSNKNNIFF